jgi:hypothetical protein
VTDHIKTYHGKLIQDWADPGRYRVWVSDRTEGTLIERDLQHYPLHSPSGFGWGYGGSGPADLALAILIDYLGEKPTKSDLINGRSLAWSLHQQFKHDFVAKFEPTWELAADRIAEWLKQPVIVAAAEEYRKYLEIDTRMLESGAEAAMP